MPEKLSSGPNQHLTQWCASPGIVMNPLQVTCMVLIQALVQLLGPVCYIDLSSYVT